MGIKVVPKKKKKTGGRAVSDADAKKGGRAVSDADVKGVVKNKTKTWNY